MVSTVFRRPVRPRTASSVSASVPPSPRLSARSTNVMYLCDATSISSQNRIDNTPRICPSLGLPYHDKDALMVYKGLVPISQNTTPSAPLRRSVEHTSEPQSLRPISYAVFRLQHTYPNLLPPNHKL